MRSRQGRRRGPLSAILITIAVLGAAAAILLGVFRIRTMEINGASVYPVQSIQEDLIYDYWSGNTLVFAWKYRSAVYESRTPYLTSVQAKIVSPGEVSVTVEEKTVTAYVVYNGANVSFDEDGLVLEISDTVYDNAILVTGVTMEEPVLYQKLSVGNSALLRTMLSIVRLLQDEEDMPLPDSIAFDSNQNITVYFGSVSVQLGQDEYLEEKVANLSSIYPQIQNQSGTLNMTAFTGKNEQISFREEEETEAVTEEPAESIEEAGDDAQNGNTDNAEENPDEGAGSAEDTQEENAEAEDTSSLTVGSGVQVFDSSGTLHNDARIVNGQVVDSSGNVIDGCSVTDEGYIKDGYWNIIDPSTGSNLNDSYY